MINAILLQGKADKALDRKYNFSFGLYSFKEAINKGKFVSKQKGLESRVKYSRTKFNRMDHAEQQEYEKKMKEKKEVYYLTLPDGCIVDCPKLVWEWANLPVVD